MRLLRNDSVAKGQVFCSQDTQNDPRFALFRGKIPHMDYVIGIYRKNQQSQFCYFQKISNGFVDVTSLTGGKLYTIGNYSELLYKRYNVFISFIIGYIGKNTYLFSKKQAP